MRTLSTGCFTTSVRAASSPDSAAPRNGVSGSPGTVHPYARGTAGLTPFFEMEGFRFALAYGSRPNGSILSLLKHLGKNLPGLFAQIIVYITGCFQPHGFLGYRDRFLNRHGADNPLDGGNTMRRHTQLTYPHAQKQHRIKRV